MHENYRDTLFNNKQILHKMKKTITTENHKIGSYELNKV